MIANTNNIKQRILDVKNGKIQEGLGVGIPEIDEYIRYKQGNFNLIIGHANVGKTTTICYLLTLWAVKHSLKFVVWSSENTPDSIMRKFIEFKMGKPIHIADEQEIDVALKWANEHFRIIDVQELYTYKDLLKEADSIAEVWQYDCLIVDPYNSLAKDTTMIRSLGSHEAEYQVASELRLWCKNRNKTIYLNAHGVTEALRRTYPKDHEYANLPMPLGLASVEGGGRWGNRSDDVICCHRMSGHESEWMFTELHVLKCKITETGGRCTPYGQPIRLRMSKNNCGFEFLGKDILHSKRSEVKDILF